MRLPLDSVANPLDHPFVRHPNRTYLLFSFPVLLSLVAEPLTGLVDTAFVKQLGATSLSALGVGTTVLSLSFWVFNFLAISTQTEIAQSLGRGESEKAARTNTLAMVLAAIIGLAICVLGWWLVPVVNQAAGANDAVLEASIVYVRIRLFGAPAVLLTMVGFGALRGLQKMAAPLYVALGVNAINILMDWWLIFGIGPFPEMGIAGAAVASVIAQWLGAVWTLAIVYRMIGRGGGVEWSDAGRLFRVGGDLFVRTGVLLLFLFWSTRSANLMGAAEGAAYHAIRQVWMFAVFLIEALAATSQTLVSYFIGARHMAMAKRVAKYGLAWGVAMGVVIGWGMWFSENAIASWLVPTVAGAAFSAGWFPAAISQPLNSVAFMTDGILWGARDYTYMRNGMLLASALGILLLVGVEWVELKGLAWVWYVAIVWIAIRSIWGVARIWPGIGKCPFKEPPI